MLSPSDVFSQPYQCELILIAYLFTHETLALPMLGLESELLCNDDELQRNVRIPETLLILYTARVPEGTIDLIQTAVEITTIDGWLMHDKRCIYVDVLKITHVDTKRKVAPLPQK